MSDGLSQSLAAWVGWLNDSRIPFMVAGSFASTYHGQPRATQDVDIVIDPTRESLLHFVAAVPSERSYVDLQAALDAFAQRDMFNLVDLQTGWKADLILRKNRPFSRTEFSRRRPAEFMGVPVFVATAEDVILSKLEWAHLCGGSERQMRDVAGVMEMRKEQLDKNYIEEWLDPLAVRPLWDQLVASTGFTNR